MRKRRWQYTPVVYLALVFAVLIGLAGVVPLDSVRGASVTLPDLRYLPPLDVTATAGSGQRIDPTDPVTLTYDPDESLSDPFNPINKYAPYSLIGSGSAVELGRLWAGPGAIPGVRDAYQFCPRCFDPYSNHTGPVTSADIANALKQADQAANYSLNLMNAINGGNWNQFLGSLNFPSTLTSQINPLLIGPRNNLPALNRWFNSSPALAPAYQPLFMTSLNSFTASPWYSAPTIPVTPIFPTCSVGNLSQPTTITFIHHGTHLLTASLLNSRCQEVRYAYIFPSTRTTQRTFVGQTWVFRDALTSQMIFGEPIFTIPNQMPQTMEFFNLTGQGNLTELRASSDTQQAVVSQSSPSTALSLLEARYESILDAQKAYYYNSSALADLRIEANQHLTRSIYGDAEYLYWSQQLEDISAQVRSTQPSYPTFAALEKVILSWSSVPASDSERAERYQSRQRLQQLQDQVDVEVNAYYAAHPEIQQQLTQLSEWISARYEQLLTTPEALLWHADWKQRWDRAYYGSNAARESQLEIQQLFEDYPDYAEYARLNSEVAALTPALTDLPVVERLAQASNALRDTTQTGQSVLNLQASYNQQVSQVLSNTVIPATIERFYGEVNQLAVGDSRYQRISANSEHAHAALASHQRRIAEAVALCYQQLGENCDPGSEPTVQVALAATDLSALTNAIASASERENTFWYSLYQSKSYREIENNVRTTLSTPLSTVQDTLSSARNQLREQIAHLQPMRDFQAASTQMLDQLCVGQSQLTALPVNDPAQEVCSRLSRMAELVSHLDSGASTQGITQVYLPLLRQ